MNEMTLGLTEEQDKALNNLLLKAKKKGTTDADSIDLEDKILKKSQWITLIDFQQIIHIMKNV